MIPGGLRERIILYLHKWRWRPKWHIRIAHQKKKGIKEKAKKIKQTLANGRVRVSPL